jgi:O-antigen/teichoic acid export membrane protein
MAAAVSGRARILGRLFCADRLGYAALQSTLLQVAAALLNFGTGVITARVLGASGRGVYAAATAWAVLLGSAATVGLTDGLLIQLRRRPETSRALVLCAMLAALLAASVLALAALVCMPLLLGAKGAGALDLARASLVLVHLGAVGSVVRCAFAGQGRYLAANLTAFLPTVLHALLLAWFLASGSLTLQSAVFSVIGGGAIALLFVLPPLLTSLRGAASDLRAAGQALVAFGRRAAPADLFALVASWSDRLVLIHLLAPAQLGIYVVAANLAQRITLFSPSVGLLLSAMSGKGRQPAAELHHLALRLTLAVYLPLALILFLVDRLVFGALYGSEFTAAAPVFRILVLDTMLARLATVSSQLYLALGRPGLNSAIRGAELGVILLLLWILAPRYGEVGAALGLLAATCVRLALAWWGLVFRLELPFPRLWLNRADLAGVRTSLGQGS